MSLRAPSRNLDSGALASGILAGDRSVVARAITLVESRRADHQAAARQLVQDLLPRTGNALRVGITGVPGVGKSTTIDALGTFLTRQGHKIAVLAVDPSSARTGGSILADKTRMARLSCDPQAFIRPSPGRRHARRRGGEDARDHADLRGGGLRRRAGGNHRHRPVGDCGRRYDGFFPGADAAGRRRRTAGLEEGRCRTRRHDRRQQGGRRQRRTRQCGRRRISRSAPHSQPAFAQLVAAGRHLFGPDRGRHRRTLDDDSSASRAGRRNRGVRRTPARTAGQVDVGDAGRPPCTHGSNPTQPFARKLPRIEAAVAEGKMSPAVAVDEIATLLGL